MKEQRTTSILQRLPVILAVTAASYELPVQAQASHRVDRGMGVHRSESDAGGVKAVDRVWSGAVAT